MYQPNSEVSLPKPNFTYEPPKPVVPKFEPGTSTTPTVATPTSTSAVAAVAAHALQQGLLIFPLFESTVDSSNSRQNCQFMLPSLQGKSMRFQYQYFPF